MRIVQSPYQARILPQSVGAPNLWRCVIEQEGSQEVVVLMKQGAKKTPAAWPCWNWRGWSLPARLPDGRPAMSNGRCA